MPTINKKMLIAGAALVLGAAALLYEHDEQPGLEYHQHQGYVFGTYYNIRYEGNCDLEQDILDRLQAFDASLSTFNKQSTISAINQGRDTVVDDWFAAMYETAEEISGLSDGAFDITVAPLVNAWGFGFTNRDSITPEQIDSIRQFVGYRSIRLEDRHIRKEDPRTMLDASAIAKGYGCDVIADLLHEKGCANYLVDIGGEVVLEGLNHEGKPWRVGITKPIDDTTGTTNELQEIIQSSHLAMATSGNYRQFYYEGGVRRSHTIDPRTGYPAGSTLLSATIVADNCMRADALATACMVVGTDSALALIERIEDAECYLIYADQDDQLQVVTSGNFPLGKD